MTDSSTSAHSAAAGSPSPTGTEPGVRGVIPTGTVFTVVLDSLNHSSTRVLFAELLAALDKQCEALNGKSADAVSTARSELVSALALMRRVAALHEQEMTVIQARIAELERQGRENSSAAQLTQLGSSIGDRIEQRVTALFERERRRHRRRDRRTLFVTLVVLLFAIVLAFLTGLLVGRPVPVGARPVAGVSG